MICLEPEKRPDIFGPHPFDQQVVDLSEVRLNFAVARDPKRFDDTIIDCASWVQ